MTLLPIPLAEQTDEGWIKHWAPFLPLIAQHSHESVADLIEQIRLRQVRLVLVMNGERPQALVGVSIRQMMNGIGCGDMIWLAGIGREQWQDLLPEFEQMLRDAGCTICRPICRPGWSPFLKEHGYKLTHVMMEKVL
jgi:hypothetical protein